MKFLVAAAVLALYLAVASADRKGDNYAVLVAGSDGWSNYRHQSDIAHAYKILIDAGVKKQNIITIVKDDIADNPRNKKYPGKIFNHPDKTTDVYDGFKADYTGKFATKETLLAVLTGDKKAVDGPVLKSGPKDNVFFYYSDHGSVNLVAMPVGRPLYAKELQEALEIMQKKEMYAEMVLYVEACESGSMFDKTLPDNMSIYATTAANPHESSYAFYYDSEIGAYLGDEYSISWMEDTDDADLYTRTIAEQTVAVRERTKGSHVCEYGDLALSNQILGNFQAGKKSSLVHPSARPAPAPGPFPLSAESVSSRDVTLATLVHGLAQNDLTAADRAALLADINDELTHRAAADFAFAFMAETLAPAGVSGTDLLEDRLDLDDWECLSASYDAVEAACGRFSDYSLQYAKMLTNTCALGISAEATAAAAATACPTPI